MELADGDMTLRLDLAVPAHATILRGHLAKTVTAMLNRAVPSEDPGWIGRAHEVVAPVVRAGPPAPNKMAAVLISRVNADGHRPGDPNARWISARVHTHPTAMDDVIANQLLDLQVRLDAAPLWMVRYRNPEQTDHLRIRVAAREPSHAARATALGEWAAMLATSGTAGQVAFDTYYPEAGRYGSGAALEAAEAVFCADTAAAVIALRQPPAVLHPDTVMALSMLDIAEAFLGGMHSAADYLTAHVVTKPQTIDHSVVGATLRLALEGVPRDLPHLPVDLAEAWAARAKALIAYRSALPGQMDTAMVAGSLLHGHSQPPRRPAQPSRRPARRRRRRQGRPHPPHRPPPRGTSTSTSTSTDVDIAQAVARRRRRRSPRTTQTNLGTIFRPASLSSFMAVLPPRLSAL
ncbi:hypothetical protein FRACA_2560006 [Frankia canadensis]|uniref:Thiopeptide-type bacteriocin biosynthesis domain-containing protein n=1 Tax=Frankia canadensis TaxID=1836972 RepID=A0A2I2KS86_9ACTN|nr:hypothetical protein FRACA_2560006 [Frankia canadensis]SOU55821.1 hypothetical protein FRACA_2560006 [Frankia canadensis]